MKDLWEERFVGGKIWWWKDLKEERFGGGKI